MLYERDPLAWAEAQAEALRRRSGNELDWEHVAEEIEDVGRSITRACESHVVNILAHLLKLEFSGLTEPRRHWGAELGEFRLALEADLTPTLEARLPVRVADLYPRAVKMLRLAYDKRGEEAPVVPETCPYEWADVLGRGMDWVPEPRGETS